MNNEINYISRALDPILKRIKYLEWRYGFAEDINKQFIKGRWPEWLELEMYDWDADTRWMEFETKQLFNRLFRYDRNN